MEDKDFYIAAVLVLIAMLLLAGGVRNSTFNDAVTNCVQANADWRVDAAHAYCNSVIREGKRP